MFFILVIFYTLFLNAFSLKEGLIITLENNPEVKIRKNNLEIIFYELDIAYRLNNPSIDLVNTLQQEKSNSEIELNSYNKKSYDFKVLLTQPIFDGFYSHYEEKLQKARYESARYYLLEATNTLALDYIESYLNVLKEEELMKLMKESYSFNSEIFNKIKIKYDKRLGTKLEYEKIRTKISESNLNISTQQSNVEESKINLRNYLQTDIDSNEIQSPEFKYNLPMNLTNALSNAYTTHPSLKISELNKKVSLNEYKRDSNVFLPKINLVGKYSKNDLDEEVNQYSVGVELKYNIYNGGKDTALSNKLLKYMNEKMIYTDKTKQEIENKMRFSWNAYFLNQSKLENLKEYVYYKKNVLDISFKEYELGMIDISDLLTIHEEYISAKKSLILIENDFLFSKFRILEATGNIVEKLIDIQEYSANRFTSEEN